MYIYTPAILFIAYIARYLGGHIAFYFVSKFHTGIVKTITKFINKYNYNYGYRRIYFLFFSRYNPKIYVYMLIVA